MKFLFSAKPLIAAVIALGAIGATSVAQARDAGRYPIAAGEPHARPHDGHQEYGHQKFGHQQPAPVNYRNARGGPFGDSDRDGIPNLHDRDSRFYDHRATRRSAEWGDYDRDGVPNKFDRRPHDPRRS
jgi:hypothetical protein